MGIVISLITLICYKKIGFRAIFVFLILLIYPHNGYNTFCLLIFMLLLGILDSDKYRDNDILIAVLISIMILTKQTMGVLIIPSLIFANNKK
jgi:hypothetical protein